MRTFGAGSGRVSDRLVRDDELVVGRFLREMMEQVLGVVADARPARPQRGAVKRDSHVVSRAPRQARRQAERDGDEHVGRREAEKGIDQTVKGDRGARRQHAGRKRGDRCGRHGGGWPASARNDRARARRTTRALTPARAPPPTEQDLHVHVVAVDARAQHSTAGVRPIDQPEVVGTDAEKRMLHEHASAAGAEHEPSGSNPLLRQRVELSRGAARSSPARPLTVAHVMTTSALSGSLLNQRATFLSMSHSRRY